MLFNSIDFALFLPIVFGLYWTAPHKQPTFRNYILLVSSYVFYGWWDWRFLSLILFSSALDYLVGLGLASARAPARRKMILTLSMVVNLGLLGVFKYFNFFVDSFVSAFTFLGMPLQPFSLDLVLPVGISFYTFQTMSYSIDVYHRRLEPSRDVVAFCTYVAFFPQLVAGPIERATNLLPQFAEVKRFDYEESVDGLRQALWGLFKKVVIADNCAEVVNLTFANPNEYSSSTLVLGAVLFAFQIYGDFSGYSDIAIGVSRLFGYDLKQNFAFPYFSRDIAEFWRRWHMSLSTWFRDYLYVPLGGSWGSRAQRVRNTLIIFLVSGLWHGANWTFVFWGLLHALFFLPLLLSNRNRRHVSSIGSNLPGLRESFQILWTFLLVVVAWVFFRADSLQVAFTYLGNIFSPTILSKPEILPMKVLSMIALMLVVEWLNRHKAHGLSIEDRQMPPWLRWMAYLGLSFLVLLFGGDSDTFIYFQF